MILAVALGAGLLPSATRAADLTVVEFNKLHRELASAREPWQSLPWRLSLIEAGAQAAKEKKPVYMLCRSGHPLGCV